MTLNDKSFMLRDILTTILFYYFSYKHKKIIILPFKFQSQQIQIFPITVASRFVTISWNTSSSLSTHRGYVLRVKRSNPLGNQLSGKEKKFWMRSHHPIILWKKRSLLIMNILFGHQNYFFSHLFFNFPHKKQRDDDDDVKERKLLMRTRAFWSCDLYSVFNLITCSAYGKQRRDFLVFSNIFIQFNLFS